MSTLKKDPAVIGFDEVKGIITNLDDGTAILYIEKSHYSFLLMKYNSLIKKYKELEAKNNPS